LLGFFLFNIHLDHIQDEHFNASTSHIVAVATLTRGFADRPGYDPLIKRNHSIEEHVCGVLRPDVLIFHESNVTNEDKEYIQSKTTMPLIFVNVDVDFRSRQYASSTEHCKTTSLSESFSMGYKNMCKFWFDGFLKHTVKYDYVIRIDEDCTLISWPGDLIDVMKGRNIRIASANIHESDSADVIVGLESLVKSKFPDRSIDMNKLPYTNLIIFDVEFFRNSIEFVKFASMINETNCIYINRWGDMPLWGMAIQALLSSKDDVLEDKRIKYRHGSHNLDVN
jgi:hypothetical protein